MEPGRDLPAQRVEGGDDRDPDVGERGAGDRPRVPRAGRNGEAGDERVGDRAVELRPRAGREHGPGQAQPGPRGEGAEQRQAGPRGRGGGDAKPARPDQRGDGRHGDERQADLEARLLGLRGAAVGEDRVQDGHDQGGQEQRSGPALTGSADRRSRSLKVTRRGADGASDGRRDGSHGPSGQAYALTRRPGWAPEGRPRPAAPAPRRASAGATSREGPEIRRPFEGRSLPFVKSDFGACFRPVQARRCLVLQGTARTCAFCAREELTKHDAAH